MIRKFLSLWFRRGKHGDGLEAKIGYVFRKPELLALALIHRSYLNPKEATPETTNERLEFLGDSVLNMLVTELLYRTFPQLPEGELSKKKSIIVSGRALADTAMEWGLGEYLRMSKGESKAGGRAKESILADAFEAVIGAVYLDGGIEPCRSLLSKVHFPRVRSFLSDSIFANFKSLLLEKLQANGMGAPEYRVLAESGPEHSKKFTIEVVVQDKGVAQGNGSSKKKAEQEAARQALELLFSGYTLDNPDDVALD